MATNMTQGIICGSLDFSGRESDDVWNDGISATTFQDYIEEDKDEIDLSRDYATIGPVSEEARETLQFPDVLQIISQLSSEDASPDHFRRYRERFVFNHPTSPFHIKYEYSGGFFQKNYRKGTRKRKPCVLGGGYGRDVVNKHLDGEYWLGMNMPYRTRQSCLDIDAKDYLVAYVERTNRVVLPGQPRSLSFAEEVKTVHPVVLLTLEHLQKIKRIYDHFPGRIWCISSQTLGLHAWETFSAPVNTLKVHQAIKKQLDQIGMGDLEVHPMKGRCLRRPFGKDYYTIDARSPRTLIQPWQEQLEYFEMGYGPTVEFFGPSSQRTPSFPDIVYHLGMMATHQMILLHSFAPGLKTNVEWSLSPNNEADTARKMRLLGLKKTPNKLYPRHFGEGWKYQWENILKWMESGFEIPEEGRTTISVEGKQIGPIAKSPESRELSRHPVVTDLDISEFRGGRWPKKLEEIARSGLPCENAIQIVIPEMAKWLWWIELFQLSESEREAEVFRLIWLFIQDKNNGHVSRLKSGNERDVQGQIRRAIQRAKDVHDSSKSQFAITRQKRMTGEYKRVICIAPLLAGGECSLSSSSSSPVYLLNVADFETLPVEITLRIKEHSGRAKIDGFALKFASFLFRMGGSQEISRKTLRNICGTKSDEQAGRYRDILVKADVVRVGRSYEPGKRSKQHTLTPWVMAALRKSQMSQMQKSAVKTGKG
jgi:hypothetical protein